MKVRGGRSHRETAGRGRRDHDLIRKGQQSSNLPGGPV